MAGRLRGAAEWLGLVSNDRYAEEEWADDELTADVPDAREAAARTEKTPETGSAKVTDLSTRLPSRAETVPAATATPTATAPAPNPAPREAEMTRIITVHPRTYNEARTIGEHFRDGVPVIMNLTEMEDVDAKRLVDFAAGLIFGLRGTIERVTSKVFLISPQNVNVTAEDKERIVGGFYNQS
ncbi:cell division protein SepF [Desertihabitans aurantiacus]|uniref:cell division protein SepF n=1 Tax=Desertihabitans aurantiacus TaxID=2282477 RepID=UPI000DF81929|nr:cell division protein SepF [Desertihabitans aurantiacus]